jgi:predicted phage baseplate assembly protein
MTLTGPVLDDRTYEQLKDALVKRIPFYTPEWTDYNESDPGIALLELFAYLGESLLFRFNQIPDATKITFLRLLGLQPRPAQSAKGLVKLETERPEGAQVLQGWEARAGSVLFETSDEVYAWPLDVVAVARRPVRRISKSDVANHPALTSEKHRQDHAASEAGVAAGVEPYFYEVVTVPADPMAPDAEPVDVSATADESLWIALLAKPTADLTQLAGRTLFVGVAFDEEIQDPFNLVTIDPAPSHLFPADLLTTDPPGVEWALWRAGDNKHPLLRLDVLSDTTRGMTTTGVVKLAVPDSFPTQPRGAASSGGRTEPPPLQDAKQAAQVVGWLRVTRPSFENDAIHKVRWVGLNAVGVVQERTSDSELLGIGNGNPSQSYALTKQSIVAHTIALDVEESSGWVSWEEVDTFSDSAPLDRHYTLDAVAGRVQFGPRSRVPQLGQRIRVTSYRYGGGMGGNLPASSITSITKAPSVKVTNVLPTAGGADAASLPDVLDSIPAQVHRRDRAVVDEDFTGLALEVTGVKRANTLPVFHPDTPREPAPGVVSVVIFPEEDLRDPGAPLPDLGLLRRVAEYLGPRRLLTTELYVIPPTYREVAISVGVEVKPGYQVDAVRRWVDLILRQYLSPLPPYGPDGAGWPLGRTVRRSELEAICCQVEGVDAIVGALRLGEIERPPAPNTGGQRPAPIVHRSKTVTLERWEVPQVSSVRVVRGPALPVQSDSSTAPPTGPVLVPIPPEVC